MVVPLGLGHKHIKTPILSWFFVASLMVSYVFPQVIEFNYIRLLVVGLIVIPLGPYIEMRAGALYLAVGMALFSVITGRVFGISSFYLEPFSAASWLAGSYFSIFYYKKFKIKIWAILSWHSEKIDNSAFVPVFFVSMWWIHIFSSPLSEQSIVLNIVPIVCFLIGTVSGLIFRKIFPVPKGFLYDFEWKRWKNLVKRGAEVKKMSRVARAILDINPDNFKVRYDICKKIIQAIKVSSDLDKSELIFFNTQFSVLLSYFIRTRRVESGLEMVSSLPIEASYQKIIVKMNGSVQLGYGKIAEKKHMNLLALTLYCAFIEKNYKSSKSSAILKKIDNLLEKEIENPKSLQVLQFLESNLVEAKTLFKQHFQFSRTAVVTAVHKKSS